MQVQSRDQRTLGGSGKDLLMRRSNIWAGLRNLFQVQRGGSKAQSSGEFWNTGECGAHVLGEDCVCVCVWLPGVCPDVSPGRQELTYSTLRRWDFNLSVIDSP